MDALPIGLTLIYCFIKNISHRKQTYIYVSLNSSTDTLLNVFLAIAVDNLASAQELTAAEEEAEEENEQVRDSL